MAYNAGFPIGYPQYYPQFTQSPQPAPQPQAQPTPSPMQSNMVWVQGEAGAKSYLLAPNTTVPLWDSEGQTIYIKSADASGMPSMKIIDYTVRESNTPTNKIAVSDYVTKQELSDFKSEIEEMVRKEIGA